MTLARVFERSQVLFAHDTEVALAAAAALANTRRETPDSLRTAADLDAFVRRWEWTGRRSRSREELAAVRALRPTLDRIWQADLDEAVELVNGLLRNAGALPQLVRHDGWDYHLHATRPDAPLADRMAVEAAMAVVDVIRMGELHRLHVCAADDCADLLVDLSKNSSRRFCSTTCANRTNVSAYRQRQAAIGRR
jgi:predicted RNA-binding Zn ribbon-like protein